MASVVSVLKNPPLAIVTDGNRLLSSERLRLQDQQPFLPRMVYLSIFSLPRGSLTWPEPLSILFIILYLVTLLFTGFVPTELFLYRMLELSCAWGRQALQDKLLC